MSSQTDSNNAEPDMNSVAVQPDLKSDEIPVSVEDLNDDIDLSDILPSNIDPALVLNSPISLVGGDESYKEIINVCSNNAQALKKTISDVLSSRENVVITDVDDTSELEASLNKKIADFNDAVDGCLKSNTSSSVDKLESSDVSVENTEENSFLKEKSCSPENTHETFEEVINSDTSSESSTSNVNTSCLKETKKNNKAKVEAEKNQSSNSNKVRFQTTSFIDEEKTAKKGKSSLSKKKGEKTIDQIMKSLSTNSTTEEKLQQLCKKHLEVLEELRSVEPRIKQLEKQVISQQREKESLQAEHNRMILAKSRLESLCREMQRQSKAVKEESLIRIKEEEEKRKEVANKFQSTLNDISALMQENSKRNTALREENAELSQKLKMLVDNYSVWEENMKKIVQQKELEAQLANAKHAKLNLELKQEQEKFLREKQSLLENMSELQKKCTLLTANELQLRKELGDYTNKYEEFQSVLSNSSKVFANFKSDMDATSKKIKKLEKETNVYKQKWESCNKALLDMISHKETQEKESANAQQRILTLEKLCRALQTERNELRNQLNAATASSTCQNEPTVPSTENPDVPCSS